MREDYDTLQEEHNTLMGEHKELQEAHDELEGWDTIDVQWEVDNWSERCQNKIGAYSRKDIPVAGHMMQLRLNFKGDDVGLWMKNAGGCEIRHARIGGTKLRIESTDANNTIEHTFSTNAEITHRSLLGWKDFAELAHISDPENGFIENDTIMITATIRAERVGANEPQDVSTLPS